MNTLRSVLNSIFILIAVTAGAASLCAAAKNISISGMTIKDDKTLVIDLETSGLSHTLSDENFSLYLNSVPAESVKASASDPDKKDILYLIISVDSSKSISDRVFQKIKKRAKEIVRENMGNELIALYRFNDEVIQLNTFSRHKPDIEKSIDSISRKGSKTLLYNSLFDCIDQLQKTKGEGKSLIVFTDGIDEGSRISADEVISLAKESGIKVSFVSVKKTPSSLSFMRKMSVDTGGVLLSIDEPDLGPALSRLYGTGLSRRYTVSAEIGSLKTEKEISADLRVKSGDQRFRCVQSLQIPPKKKITVEMIGFIVLAVLMGLCCIIFFGMRYGSFLILKKDRTKKVRVNGSLECGFSLPEQNSEHGDGSVPTIPEPSAWLYRKEGQGKKEKFPVHSCGLIIGRSKSNGLIIDDPEVSLIHAQIRREKDTYYLFDMVSEFGVLLNDKKVLRPRILHDWDEIKIGQTVFVFRIPK